MKKLFLFFIVFLYFNKSYAQQLTHLRGDKSNYLRHLLINTDSVAMKFNEQIILKVFIINNGSGSAKIEGTDGRSSNVYIVVSTIDDSPDTNLYKLGNLISPKILSIEERSKDTYLLTIAYYTLKQKIIKQFEISEAGCKEQSNR